MQCYEIPLLELVLTMANAADLISPVVANHHKRVAYIAHSLAVELGLPVAARQNLVVAASLHDLGAFSIEDRVDMLEFEAKNPDQHAELGYAFFHDLAPFTEVARIIRFHHTPWRDGRGCWGRGCEVPLESHVLHLADRVDVASFQRENILSEVEEIQALVLANEGSLFVPEHARAFAAISEMEYFWLDLRSPALDDILRRSVETSRLEMNSEAMVDLARLLSHLVDFKSQYTSTHTAGVARTAELLAAELGLDRDRQQQVLLAGFLHDVGKVAIPREILDKPKYLEDAEYGLIKSHAYFTRRIVETISGMYEIADWAASHHEHLDGTGYPYHISELPMESRIIAVADVFTAMSEDRPYRPGMPYDEVKLTLLKMVRDQKLDREVVQTLIEHHETIDRERQTAQAVARADYNAMVDRAMSIGR